MANTRVVGQPLPRIDAERQVRGEAIFAADVQLPGLLVGKYLPSPHAHAEILALDVSQAEALPGVQAVISAADIPQVETFDPDSRYHAFIARRFVVFAGQPVAAVAADDLATAEAALELIKVEYRPLRVVRSVQEAILPDSPRVSREITAGPEGNSMSEEEESFNIVNPMVFAHGDTATAFAESDVIVEGTYTVPVIHQGYIEPHAVTAHWDQMDHVTVWECTQGAFWARDIVADTLGIPCTNITLNSTEIGGGFGGKIGMFAPLAILLAKKARRPVRLTLTRREELIGANPAPHTVIWLKIGARKDGTLTAIEAKTSMDAGAFPSEFGTSVGISAMLRNKYRFQAWHLESKEVLTNKVSTGSYRAPGAINAAFAIESQVDEIASQLGLDPLALRLRNIAEEGDLLANLQPQVQHGAKEVLTALAEHPAWTEPASPRLGEDGLLHGRGVGLGSWGSGSWPAAAAAVLEADGKIRILLGQVDLTGSFTSLAQIAAEALGVTVGQVVMHKASPDFAPYAPVSGGSGTIYSMGAAVKEAALDLRGKLLARAAQELHVTEAELEVNGTGVFVAADAEQSCSFQRLYELETDIFVAKYAPLMGHGSVVSRSRRRAPVFAASVAEVAVDPQTGQVTLSRLITAQDVGQAINPLSVEGQIQGAAVQSVGLALWEEVMYDEQGNVRNPSLLDYHMPTAADVPMIETILVEAPGGDGPYGAKGVGEPPMISPVAAVANAVAAAIGTRIYNLPITSERVWRALLDEAAPEG